jgi:peptidoglycan/LPS O-acetylase OafA/YrhL
LKRVLELDGIRGLAVSGVVAYHTCLLVSQHSASALRGGTGLLVGAVLSVVGVGWLGVDVFFVLSGYLITAMILKERTSGSFWRDFYLRRALRILPPLVVVILLCVAIAHFLFPEMRSSPIYIWASIFFVANWTILFDIQTPLLGHLWSLAVEEQFYLVWPQAAGRLSYRTLLMIALGVAAFSEILRTVLMNLHLPSLSAVFITPDRIDGICIGSAIALSMEMPKVRGFLVRRWKSLAVIFSSLAIFSLFAIQMVETVSGIWMTVIMIPLTILATSMMIVGSITSSLPENVKKYLGNRLLVYLGTRSYALYLIHEPIRAAVSHSLAIGYLSRLPKTLFVDLSLILGVVLISIALTELSWRLIERPAQRLRRRMQETEEVRDRPVLAT